MQDFETAAVTVVLTLGFVIANELLATTLHLHRELTHGSMRAKGPLRLYFRHMVWSAGVNPRQWVGVHRKHHAYSDRPPDPHSPRNFGSRLRGILRVFFTNAALYHRVAKDDAQIRRLTRDYQADKLDEKLYLHALYGPLVFMPIVYLAGFLVADLVLGLSLWWVLVQAAFCGLTAPVLYMAGGSVINALGHSAEFRGLASDFSRNLGILLSLFTMGEGRHENHHRHPSWAAFLQHREIILKDIGFTIARAFEMLGLMEIRMPKGAYVKGWRFYAPAT